MPWARYGVGRGRCACSELTGAASQLPPPITEKQALARDRGGAQIPGGGSNCRKAWLGPRHLGWGRCPPEEKGSCRYGSPKSRSRECSRTSGHSPALPALPPPWTPVSSSPGWGSGMAKGQRRREAPPHRSSQPTAGPRWGRGRISLSSRLRVLMVTWKQTHLVKERDGVCDCH